MRAVLVVMSLIVACVLGAGPGNADPLGDLTNPGRDAASILPSPVGDPWMYPAPGFENTPPGTILHTRPVLVGPLFTDVASTQLLIRSSDSHDQPVPVATTVMVPRAPWPGPGPRPVVAYNTAIDSLGLDCVPSRTLVKGTEIEVVAIQMLLARSYAVVVTDHQGPRQAYAAGRMSGHAVLDALRAAVNAPWLGLAPDAAVAVSGYSGGAIASGWAAELQPSYAPELNLVGAAVGGPPADYRVLLGSMNGRNLASGVFLSATLGVAREYPELLTLFNDNGWRLASLARDWCLTATAPAGVVPMPAEALSDIPDVVNHPVAQRVLNDTRMGNAAPTAPVYIYQGQQDPWIPRESAARLASDWCAGGANVVYVESPGEHLIVAVGGLTAAFDWLGDRIAGRPVGGGCRG